MNFELKLDMYNAEQEVVWLRDHLLGADPQDMVLEVKESEAERGTLSGGVLLPVLIGVVTGIASKRVDWLFSRVWEYFYGKKGKIDFTATCPDGGKSFTMSFELGNEKERDAAQDEFQRRYERFCSPNSDS